ncbi:MAG: hypothetical protein B7X82_01025 [Hydrogenophilales bacterium 17-64-65]|nr:MAG: hypothetical protein B7X82_01025 [Hydrogenophilales bacterium 17-64-65]
MFEKIAFVFLGWLLGLLGPVIIDAIRRKRENDLGRLAIKTELANLRVKLAFASYTIEEHQGSMTRLKLKWVIKQLGLQPTDEQLASVTDTLKKLLEASDEELSQHFASRKGPPGKSLTLQRYNTPLLDARVSALWSFDTSSQRILLEIRSALDIAAEIIDRATHFTNLTFQKLENGNHQRAVENVTGCYDQYAAQAKRIVELIDEFQKITTA